MTLENFLALLVFAFASSITPGPNNFMLLASGVNFGFLRTVPHMLGIAAGFFALLMAVGFGLGLLIENSPGVFLLMKIAGGAYLLYLAWKIAMTRSLGVGASDTNPMSFLAAALFQWVNPKAWVMALAAMAAYPTAENYSLGVWLVATAFAIVNLPCVSVWCGFGTSMREWLSNPTRLKWFNMTMGLLLALSLWPMLA